MTRGLRSYLQRSAARPLGEAAAAQVAAVLAGDPVGTCMVGARFECAGMDRQRLGGTFWGTGGARGGLCFVGANVMPLSGDRDSLTAMAEALRAHGRRSSSIVGRADLVGPLWDRLRPWWGPARQVRPDQPLMVCPDLPAVAADLRVVVVRPDQLDAYFPAAVAMFTEEVGVDPTAGDGGVGYRTRVAELVGAGRAFAIFDGSTVIFKAEVGSLSRRVALIQGVWVHPDWRGRHVAPPATAAVVAAVQRWGRLPSLYVNGYNTPARATYRRVGFHRVGTFATVLFQ